MPKDLDRLDRLLAVALIVSEGKGAVAVDGIPKGDERILLQGKRLVEVDHQQVRMILCVIALVWREAPSE